MIEREGERERRKERKRLQQLARGKVSREKEKG
jgi:hypothetical protein